MNIHVIAVGMRMPGWVKTGYEEYARRLPGDCRLLLHEIKSEKRHKNLSAEQVRAREKERILALVPAGALLGVLDVQGSSWDTEQLAVRLADWMNSGRSVALVIGGPDGIDAELLKTADFSWSLSKLTYPHPLVRIILAEQIYRAWSIIKNHPYHRGETG